MRNKIDVIKEILFFINNNKYINKNNRITPTQIKKITRTNLNYTNLNKCRLILKQMFTVNFI